MQSFSLAASAPFLLGHSHVSAIVQAIKHHELNVPHLNLWVFGRPVDYSHGGKMLDPSLKTTIGQTVISVVGGSAHDVLGLARHDAPFDFVLPSAPGLPLIEGAEVLPASAVAAALRRQIEDEIIDLVCLLARSGRRVVHLEPPPPVGDDPRLARELDLMGFVPNPERGPSPRWLRFKMWRLHSEMIRDLYERDGVEFLSCPPASQDDAGFLKSEYYGYPCHANVEYGSLVLRQLGLIA